MNDRAIIRSFETGQGKRVAILALVVLVLALVFGVVAVGFRGRHVTRNTDALTKPHETTSHVRAPFPSR